jgi:cytochrome c oxidase subunit 2
LATLAAPALVARAQTPSILDPAGPNAAELANLYNVIFFIAVGVFALVEALILYAIFAFRRRDGDPEPVQVHGNVPVEVAWTIVPAVIVSVLAMMSARTLFGAYRPPADALTVNAVGKQWFWEFQYTDPVLVTATDLVIPVGQPVRVFLDSADVVHSFWAPQLFGKQDAVPGERDGNFGQNSVWFVADRPGRFFGHCAEYCGAQHSGMRFEVVAMEPAAYEAWREAQQRPAPAPEAGSAAARGLELVTTRGCQGCHTIDGVEGMVGKIGPNLTHVMSRPRLAGGVFETTPENLASWIGNPQALKPGTTMPDLNVDEAAIADIVAYLQTLE